MSTSMHFSIMKSYSSDSTFCRLVLLITPHIYSLDICDLSLIASLIAPCSLRVLLRIADQAYKNSGDSF
jgi:hypothetical protein